MGEMAKFRSTIDNNPAAKLNRYYTVTGTSWGPVFSALSMGGLYLSSYGSNDGLVNEWSAKLPYGTHLLQILDLIMIIYEKDLLFSHELNHIYVQQMYQLQL